MSENEEIMNLSLIHIYLRVLHNRLARGEQTARVGIAFAVGQLLTHILNDLIGRAETKGRRITDVELEDALALVLHTGGLVDDGTAHVIQDVYKRQVYEYSIYR